jgi:hypothetical protein
MLALSLTLAACGTSDENGPGLGAPPLSRIPGCEQFDPAACDVKTTECQERLLGLAACLRGSDATELPPVTIMSESEFSAYLEQQYAQQDPPRGQAKWQQAFVMLNLVAPGGLEPDAEIAQATQNIWGFYDADTKSVSIIDHGSDSNLETASSALLHEFVHVLQDRDIDLTAYAARTDVYDASLAAKAITEGEARFHEERYDAAMLGLDWEQIDWYRLFENEVNSAAQWVLKQDSPLTAAWDAFPYAWGARFVHLGWDATGHAGVLELLAAPPGDTELVMASSKRLSTDVGALEIPVPAAPATWNLIGEEVLGAFGTFELAGRHPTNDSTQTSDSAQSLALAWRGDRLSLFEDANETLAVVWIAEFADAGAASSAADIIAPRSLGTTLVRTRDERLVVAVSSDISNLDWAYEAIAN